jgi:MFS family permease
MKSIVTIAKITFIVVVIAAALASGEFTGLLDGAGMAFVLLGCLGMMLMSFSFPEIGRAFKHAVADISDTESEKQELRVSAYFWESAARSLLIMGAMGAVIGFVINMHFHRGGMRQFFEGTRISFLTIVYGIIPAALCVVAALVIKKKMEDHKQQDTPAKKEQGLRIETFIGYVLFIAVMIWAVSPGFALFFHWPSLLVTVGWALVLIVLLGNAAAGHTVTLSFAFTGLMGTFIGLVKMFYGFSIVSIQQVSAGMTFSILSCIFAMLGMMMVGMPIEDRAFKEGINGKGTVLSRIAWYGFPILGIFLVIYSMILATIPIVNR